MPNYDTVALMDEWAALRGSEVKSYTREDKTGRVIYGVESTHGRHESYDSYAEALFLLVDSHRLRVEDLPETRARLEALGLTAKDALRRCQDIGLQVTKDAGLLPVAEHDALVEIALKGDEAAIQAETAAKAALLAEREAAAAAARAAREAEEAAGAAAKAAAEAAEQARIDDLMARVDALEAKVGK